MKLILEVTAGAAAQVILILAFIFLAGCDDELINLPDPRVIEINAPGAAVLDCVYIGEPLTDYAGQVLQTGHSVSVDFTDIGFFLEDGKIWSFTIEERISGRSLEFDTWDADTLLSKLDACVVVERAEQ